MSPSVKKLDSATPGASSALARLGSPPLIADYDLIERIGAGAYGEVWRAHSTATGALRAVKVVYRTTFNEDRPFNREFEGIKKFEDISRSHPSQLAIFHVGRNDAAECFYYVMELADRVGATELSTGSHSQPDADSYSPHTLRRDLETRGPLRAARVVELSLALTEALAHLHKHGLVHRDIKPANIIFVNGRPKLADIGLVTDAGDARSIVGTEGYLAPEGPGTSQADIFALGKVLYEAATGLDRREFPKLPPNLRAWPDARLVFELNEIFLRACATNPRERYCSAEDLRRDVARLVEGKSVRRAHQSEKRWRIARLAASWLTVAVGLVSLIAYLGRVSRPPENPEVTKRSTNEFAQQQYELGRRFLQLADDTDTAAKHFQAAFNADPNFVLAQAALAKSLCNGGTHPLSYDQYPRLSEAEAIAERALARDNDLSDAHLVVGWHACVRERDWNKATWHFEKAIRCDPGNWEPRIWYGVCLMNMGRINQAMNQAKMAERLGGSESVVPFFFGNVLCKARRFAEAAEKFQTTIDMPEMAEKSYTYLLLARAEFWRDRTDEAAEKWVEATYGAKEAWVSDLKRVLHEQGQAAFWNQRLEAVRERTKDPLILAEACAMAGRTTEALHCLEKACREHHDFLVFCLKNDPEWDTLRREQRFKNILKMLNLSD